MAGAEGLPERLRAVRRLHGLTQIQLAAMAGVSVSLYSKVEAGHRPASWDFAVAIAKAAHVDAGALMGQHAGGLGDVGRIAEAIPALRRVLAEYDYPPERHAPLRPLRQLADEVDQASRLRLAAQYVALGELLPDLIEELTQAAHALTGRERELAFGLLMSAYRCADAIAFKTGYLDLSSTAIDRIRWSADQSGDELLIGTAAYVRGQTYLVTEAYESGLRALTAAGSALERRAFADPRAAAVYGAIHMRAAVLAARGSMADAAWSHIAIAKAMAEVVAHDVEYFHTSFGPSNVRIHEVTVAVELGDEREALVRANGFTPPASLSAERASHYLIDLARAQTWAADYSGALASLMAARVRAPQHTRTNRLAITTAGELVRRESRRTDGVLGLATWLGVSA